LKLIDEKSIDGKLIFCQDDINELINCKTAYQNLGLIKKAINTCNFILKIDKNRIDILGEVAEMYYDLGNYSDYEKIMNNCIQIEPQEINHYKELASHYFNMNEFDKIYDLVRKGKSITNSDYFNKMEKRLLEIEKRTSQIDPPENFKNHIIDFINLFQGRENVYARQWRDDSGKCGYVPVWQPINFNVINNHFVGNMTCGVYPINIQNNVKFLTLDLDIQKYALESYQTDKNYYDKLNIQFKEMCLKCEEILKQHHIFCYFEFSGFKGFHIWIFFKEWISASTAKIIGDNLRTILLNPEFPINIEVFPKQGKVTSKNLGNLIKLPFSLHLKTNARSYFLDSTFNKISVTDFFINIKLNEKEDIYKLAKNIQNEADNISKNALDTLQKSQNDNDNNQYIALDETGKTIDVFNFNDSKEVQWLRQKCQPINKLIEKAEINCELSNQEQLVVLYVLGHLQNGVEIVNGVFKKCLNISPDRYMKSNFKGNPVSCPKIRSRLGQLVDRKKCNCTFSNMLNTYPHPILHLNDMNNMKIEVDPNELKTKLFIENYLEMKKDHRELSNQLDIKQKVLFDYLNNNELNEIDTSFGKLKIIKDGENFQFQLIMNK